MCQERIIIHIDMDAFFSSIEQRDNPKLLGKPVIIAGDLNKRSVVSTCSYEARVFGIYSSMPSKTAYHLCPNGIFIKPRINYYRTVSESIFDIFKEYTDFVEPLSLDEAFLDVTHNKYGIDSGVEVARQIKERIVKEVHLTGSAGVSFNKFIAKIASDYQKPDGLTELNRNNYQEALDKLDIRKFFGIGKVSAATLRKMGVQTGKDLRKMTEQQLRDVMHARGSVIYQYLRGIDERPVEPNRQRKSIGKETTLTNDITPAEVLSYLQREAVLLADELKMKGIKGHTVTMKIKYHDFMEMTRQLTSVQPIQSEEQIMDCIRTILEKNTLEDKAIRLVGIYLSKISGEGEQNEQLTLWDL